MNQKQIDEFTPFWSSDISRYVLVSVEPGSADLSQCVIVDRQRKSAELIEDPEIALEVMRRMVDAGVEIVSKVPD